MYRITNTSPGDDPKKNIAKKKTVGDQMKQAKAKGQTISTRKEGDRVVVGIEGYEAKSKKKKEVKSSTSAKSTAASSQKSNKPKKRSFSIAEPDKEFVFEKVPSENKIPERKWSGRKMSNEDESGYGREYGAKKFTESERARLRASGMSAEEATQKLNSQGRGSSYTPTKNATFTEINKRQAEERGVLRRSSKGRLKRD